MTRRTVLALLLVIGVASAGVRALQPPAQSGPKASSKSRRQGRQTKLSAASVLPVPFHTATSGYLQSGRLRVVSSGNLRDARIMSGA